MLALSPIPVTAAPVALPPWDAVVLDIETADGSPEDAERFIRSTYQPDSIRTWKPETLGQRIKDAYQAKLDKLALLDASPIVIVSLRTATDWICLHSLFAHPAGQHQGAMVAGFESQAALLVALRDLLDARCSASTVIAGHNVLEFDLRKLRHAFTRERVRCAAVLSGPDQPVFDTMKRYGSFFSIDRKDCRYVSLDDVLEAFGLQSHKGAVDGAMVPELVRLGEYRTLIEYALMDVATEWAVFQLMTGSAPDLR